MNGVAALQLGSELVVRLRQEEESGNLAIDWGRLIKYLPEIIDLIMKIINDQQTMSADVVAQPLSQSEIDAINWQQLIALVLQFLQLIGLAKNNS